MDTKINCVLLDDELPGLAYLKMLCEQIPELEVVKAFDDPAKFLSEMGSLQFELCITDVQMPGMDGLTLASSLQGKMIIFITAHKDYAAEAFDIEAIDYITKPVKKERLEKAVHKAVEKFLLKKEDSKFLQFNTDKGRVLLYFHRIVSITASSTDSRDKDVLLDDGSHMLLKNINFTTLLAKLPAFDFCRVNKQQLIALKAIKFFNHNEITLNLHKADGPVPAIIITETFRPEFLAKAGHRFIT